MPAACMQTRCSAFAAAWCTEVFDRLLEPGTSLAAGPDAADQMLSHAVALALAMLHRALAARSVRSTPAVLAQMQQDAEVLLQHSRVRELYARRTTTPLCDVRLQGAPLPQLQAPPPPVTTADVLPGRRSATPPSLLSSRQTTPSIVAAAASSAAQRQQRRRSQQRSRHSQDSHSLAASSHTGTQHEVSGWSGELQQRSNNGGAAAAPAAPPHEVAFARLQALIHKRSVSAFGFACCCLGARQG